MEMRYSIKYSQNFLKDGNLVTNILSKSSITNKDLVLEIGSGKGVITDILLERSKKVIAYEIDSNLANKLKEIYKNNLNIEIINCDFLTANLPNQPYKVFSNIPFNQTSEIVKKLVFSQYPPNDIYLIIQKEAIENILGLPVGRKSSLFSVIIKNMFSGSLFYTFKKTDFIPSPNVDTGMIRLKRREFPKTQPLELFQDFVTFGFSQFEPNILLGLSKIMDKSRVEEVAIKNHFSATSKPSQLIFEDWLALYYQFLNTGNKSKVLGCYKRMLEQQSKLQKVHRTRNDKDWRKY